MRTTILKAGAALAVLLLAGLCLTAARLVPDPLGILDRAAEPLGASFRPITEEGVAEREPALRGGRADPRRPGVAEDDTPTPEPTTVGIVEAVIVDASGRAIADAKLREVTAGGVGRAAASASDGRVRLGIDVGDAERRVTVEATKRGYASRAVALRLGAGRTARMGRIELLPGGGISGRVVDDGGHGIVGALVTQVPGSLSPSDARRRRYVPSARAEQRMSVPRAVSDPEGAFALAGLEAGSYRLWVEATGRLPTWTDPVEVRQGKESYGVEVILPKIAPKDHVYGVVLDPAGEPVPYARLGLSHASRSGGLSISGLEDTAGADGTFDFLLFEDARLGITARDPAGSYGPASAEDVPTGAGRLVLQLTAPAPVTLRVLDDEGRPVERYAFRVLSADERLVRQESEADSRPRGIATLSLPDAPFLIRVTAPLHEVALAGPHDPDAIGIEIVMRLRSIPGLTGRVLADGEPLAGARVRLNRAAHDDEFIEMNGFRCKLDPIESDETTTDEAGRFVLTAHVADDYYVTAATEGFARCERGPLALGPDVSARPIELHLGRGGGIEGRVVEIDGEAPTGLVVVARRGDGSPRTLRVGPEGAFRFEGLTPGRWIVERAEVEVAVAPGSRTVTTRTALRGSFLKRARWSCEVEEGRTITYDLRLVPEVVLELRGSLRIEGQAPRTWIARLLPPDATLMDAAGPGTPLDQAGHFELTASEEGPHLLALRGTEEEKEHEFLLAPVDVRQEVTSWAVDLPSGSLVVEGVAPPDPEEGMPSLGYLWNGPGGILYLCALYPDADGIARLAAVPTGPGKLVRPTMETLDPQEWEVAVEVTVSRGKETRVAVPER